MGKYRIFNSKHCSFNTILGDKAIYRLIDNVALAILFSLVFLDMISTNSAQTASSQTVSAEHLTIIQKGASVFNADEPLKGYEVFLQRFNQSGKSTIFTSEHLQDIQVSHEGSDDFNKNLIVLSGNSETVKVPFKNVTTYLVMRKVKSQRDRYTSHLAYIRYTLLFVS
jgi:hypothetical protein